MPSGFPVTSTVTVGVPWTIKSQLLIKHVASGSGKNRESHFEFCVSSINCNVVRPNCPIRWTPILTSETKRVKTMLLIRPGENIYFYFLISKKNTASIWFYSWMFYISLKNSISYRYDIGIESFRLFNPDMNALKYFL